MRRIIAVLLLLASPLWAQTYPDYVRTTVTDSADLLTDAQEAALDSKLSTLRQDTGIEFAVLTLPSQAPFAPDITFESFATGLFNHWGIGNATRNDGILVLVLSEDRAMRIELGAGYGRDWDRVAAEVINRSFLPAFADDDYAAGITDGVDDVIASIASPFADGSAAPVTDTNLPSWMVVIAFLGSFLIIGRQKLADLMTRFRRCPVCGNRGLSRTRKTLRKPTKSNAGSGEILTRCSQCRYRDVQPYTLSRTRSSSGGSFGGGRSGGGGASGRW